VLTPSTVLQTLRLADGSLLLGCERQGLGIFADCRPRRSTSSTISSLSPVCAGATIWRNPFRLKPHPAFRSDISSVRRGRAAGAPGPESTGRRRALGLLFGPIPPPIPRCGIRRWSRASSTAKLLDHTRRRRAGSGIVRRPIIRDRRVSTLRCRSLRVRRSAGRYRRGTRSAPEPRPRKRCSLWPKR